MKPTHFPPIPTMANGSFLEGNERNMEEIGGRTQSWENLQERARLSAILWAPRGEIILGVLEMPGTPQKRKWAANHQISPEIGQNCQKTNETQTFPTHSHYGQRDFFGRKWTEYGRNRGAYAKLGKLVGESQIECHFVGFPQGRNYKWANALVRPTPIWRAMVIGCYPMWYLKMEDLPSTCGNSSIRAMMINHGI